MLVPTEVSVTWTPEALPAISMPLPLLPEIIQVRTVLLPPVEVMRIPSRPLGEAKVWNAAIPPKVLKEMKPLAVSRTKIPLSVLPEMTFPSGMTPPTCVF